MLEDRVDDADADEDGGGRDGGDVALEFRN